MQTTETQPLTELLQEWSSGDQAAAEQALPLVYDELKQVAGRAFHRANWQHTLQATDLVHETYLRLRDQGRLTFKDRCHFYGVASRLMRQILVDSIRRRLSAKRGGRIGTVALEEAGEIGASRAVDLIALDDALVGLAAFDQRKATIVELRFFGGLTILEISDYLGIAPATVHREWRRARAWLGRELKRDET